MNTDQAPTKRRARGMNAPFAAALAIVIEGGLALDATGARWSQPSVDLAAWVAFAVLVLRSASVDRLALAACLVFATAGEIFLALVWQLYDYRLGNLPLFVPPGHVLLYALGLWASRWLPPAAIAGACAAIALIALALALGGGDQLSLALTGLFLLSVRFGPSPRLYVTMFGLAAAMELWGTWLGNWTWQAEVPWLELRTLNPPFAAGAFYCVLDWLVGIVRGIHAQRLAPVRQS
jgi:hypothetical protein